MLALPIFPCSHPQSIFGADELNFCVRDGNRWTLAAINTNLYICFQLPLRTFSILPAPCSLVKHFLVSQARSLAPDEACFGRQEKWREQSAVFAVRRKRNAASFILTGDPYRIRTDVNGVRGRCLNHLTNGPWCAFTDSNRGPTD